MADLRLSLVLQFSDWSKVTYSQVHGSPVLKPLLLQSFWCISATRFAELIHFWQYPKWRRNRNFWRNKNLVFHWREISYFVFIYIFLLVLLLISSSQIHNLELARSGFFNIETLNSGANPPLQNSFIEFDVAVATLENLLQIAVLNKRVNKMDMEKVS